MRVSPSNTVSNRGPGLPREGEIVTALQVARSSRHWVSLMPRSGDIRVEQLFKLLQNILREIILKLRRWPVMSAHRVFTCYSAHKNAPRKADRYSIFLPRKNGRLSWRGLIPFVSGSQQGATCYPWCCLYDRAPRQAPTWRPGFSACTTTYSRAAAAAEPQPPSSSLYSQMAPLAEIPTTPSSTYVITWRLNYLNL